MTGYWLHLAIGLGIIWGAIAVMVAQRIRIDLQDFTIACLRERLARQQRAAADRDQAARIRADFESECG